jgi:hypothetical protein
MRRDDGRRNIAQELRDAALDGGAVLPLQRSSNISFGGNGNVRERLNEFFAMASISF